MEQLKFVSEISEDYIQTWNKLRFEPYEYLDTTKLNVILNELLVLKTQDGLNLVNVTVNKLLFHELILMFKSIK